MDQTETGPLLEPQNVRPRRNRRDTESCDRAKIITMYCLLMSSLFVGPCLLITIKAWRSVVQPAFYMEIPACYIEKLHIFPVHGTSNETQVINATSVFFDLIFIDMYAWGKIYCENVTMTFYYQDNNNITLPIGNISIPKFVVEKDSATLFHMNQTFELNLEDAAGIDVKNENMMKFGITLDTKFRASSWYSDSPRSRIYPMELQANVTVNDKGMSLEDQVWLSPEFRGELSILLENIAAAISGIGVLCYICLLGIFACSG